ncbi:MAG TPA: FtsW/RodA/SpoVE family cell cycle protein [Candidatus Limnocylindrales bacterium]|jgi:cell division protein FtsW (lipid II flippase)
MSAAGLAGAVATGPLLRPRLRGRELWLLVIVGVGLTIGSVALGATQRLAAASGGKAPSAAALFQPADTGILLAYLGALLAVHLALVLAGRRTDQVILPTVGLLGGIGLLLMERLPQDLAGGFGGLARTQLVWLFLGLGVLAVLAVAVRNDAWLRRYKYTWAVVGLALLFITFVFGRDVNGARLSIALGPVTGQPSELLKVILVVFFAGYLSENRSLLVEQSTKLGPIRVPPVPYLAPMIAMLAIALGIVVIERDLGAAMLFFLVFLLLLYVTTARLSYVVIGVVAFLAGSAVLYQFFGTIRTRIDVWLNPFADPTASGYQIVQALHAFARGGIIGMGLGNGLPTIAGRPPIPALHTDFPLAALGEELGLVGVLAILGLYFVLIERGLRIAASAQDDFRALLAAGLSLVIGVQAFIIAAGNLELIPLTGITLPFISYGGSSLLANSVIAGLLIALSDRGPEVRPPRPPGRGPLARMRGRP